MKDLALFDKVSQTSVEVSDSSKMELNLQTQVTWVSIDWRLRI